MIKVDGTTIYCTRGDNGNTLGDNIVFGYEDVDGNPVSFTVGQKVVFKVFDPKNVNNVFIQKEVDIEEICTEVTIPLTDEDTSFGELINKPVTYNYEISIDDTGTIIGYDDEGPKKFILLPEGGEKQ